MIDAMWRRGPIAQSTDGIMSAMPAIPLSVTTARLRWHDRALWCAVHQERALALANLPARARWRPRKGSSGMRPEGNEAGVLRSVSGHCGWPAQSCLRLRGRWSGKRARWEVAVGDAEIRNEGSKQDRGAGNSDGAHPSLSPSPSFWVMRDEMDDEIHSVDKANGHRDRPIDDQLRMLQRGHGVPRWVSRRSAVRVDHAAATTGRYRPCDSRTLTPAAWHPKFPTKRSLHSARRMP
jgi:hypothetical protein